MATYKTGGGSNDATLDNKPSAQVRDRCLMGISMGISDWMAFIITFSTAVFSPGPDFLAVLRSSLKAGKTSGIAVAAGISMGTLLWSIATLGGILAILNADPDLTQGAKIIGAVALSLYGVYILYTIYLKQPAATIGSEQGEKTPSGFWAGFKLGLFTNTIANPKAVIFFSVIFVSLIPANICFWEAILLTGYMVIFPFLWFSLIAFISTRPPFIRAYSHVGRVIDTVLGFLFIILGILLLL